MAKVLTNELRWLCRDNKKVLQQRWYWQWGNSYTWEDVPIVTETTTAKEILSDENIIKMANEYTGGEEDYKAFVLACNVIAEKLKL